MAWFTYPVALSQALVAVVTLSVSIFALLLGNFIFTSIRYRFAQARHQDVQNSSPHAPPHLPYIIPWLGHTTSFLSPEPGRYWRDLRKQLPPDVGACTILLGGAKYRLVLDPYAIQQLFKSRGLTRDHFNNDVAVKGMGLPAHEISVYYGYGEPVDAETGLTPLHETEMVNSEYLLKVDNVNELTSTFIKILQENLRNEVANGQTVDINLNAWIRRKMFTASATTLFGSRLLEMYPDFEFPFYETEASVLSMFFGIPRFIIPRAYASREESLTSLEKWAAQMRRETKDVVPDARTGSFWEPHYGSRYNRARQRYYEKRGLSVRGRAALDLGTLFGILSNAVPAAGWMLLHILNPKDDSQLHNRVLTELKTIVKADGNIDVVALCNLPLLLSIFHEVLRVYCDVLVTRVSAEEDLILTLSDKKRRIIIKKNDIVVAPTGFVHFESDFWQTYADLEDETTPDASQFYAERFLTGSREHPEFGTAGTGGRLFPFGGGKAMCPGRVFAKQEILAMVAVVLLNFDIETVGFVDGNPIDGYGTGKTRTDFPVPKHGQFVGATLLTADGDIKVKLKSRGK